MTRLIFLISGLCWIASGAAAEAGGVDIGGLVGGIGGIMQGAAQLQMQREQMQQQLQFQKQILLQQQQMRGTNTPTYTDPPPAISAPVGAASPARTVEADGFRVDNHVLGSTLSYSDMAIPLTCRDSEQFSGFEWCRGTRAENGVEAGLSIMRSTAGGDIRYYSKFYPSAVFSAGAVKAQIDDLSTRHHLSPRVETMPAANPGEGAVIATWGQLRLVRLAPDVLKLLANGAQVREGILVDFLANARMSAKRGLPVYRLSGGAGYYWTAQWDKAGKGTLRFGIADASAWETEPPPALDNKVASSSAPSAVSPGPPVPRQKQDAPERAPVSIASSATPPPAPSIDRQAAPTPVSVASKEPTNVPVAPAAIAAVPDQGRRVALVIGNSAYQSVPRLINPTEDAEAVADTLRMVGFDSVVLVEDASLDRMKEALIAFEQQSDDADWAVLYYAGHGIEIGGQNYLIPVNAKLASDREADDEAYALRRVLDKMRNARKLHLAIIDACRDNPFQVSMKRQLASRAVSRGLARIEPAVPTEIIVYSARDGSQALDGDSGAGHSPFAKALINRMAVPNVEINKMFRQITADVIDATKGQQQPFVYGSIPGDDDYYFRVK